MKSYAINNEARIAGEAVTPAPRCTRSVFSDGSDDRPGTLGAESVVRMDNTWARWSVPPRPNRVWHAFPYTDGGMTDLNDQLAADSGWLTLTGQTYQ